MGNAYLSLGGSLFFSLNSLLDSAPEPDAAERRDNGSEGRGRVKRRRRALQQFLSSHTEKNL